MSPEDTQLNTISCIFLQASNEPGKLDIKKTKKIIFNLNTTSRRISFKWQRGDIELLPG